MTILDPFASYSSALNSPVNAGFDITPDDANDLSVLTRALMVGTGGDVAVRFKDGSEVILPALAPGVIYPLRVARILSTGTSAGNVKGLY